MSKRHAVARSLPVLLMSASDEQPAIPPALGNVFLRASKFGWYIRWNGQGAYVGTPNGRKKSSLLGLELLEKLLDRPTWQGSPTQLLGLVHGYHGSMSSQDVFAAMGIEGAEDDDRSGEQNAGFGSTTLCDQATARQVLRCIRSAEAMVARKLPTLADYLRITLLPPSIYDGVWSYELARWNKSEYETPWTCGHCRRRKSRRATRPTKKRPLGWHWIGDALSLLLLFIAFRLIYRSTSLRQFVLDYPHLYPCESYQLTSTGPQVAVLCRTRRATRTSTNSP
jgi:hypothetical protein